MDKKLFTPGPMGISMTTKQAMLRDIGSRDPEFIAIIKEIRQKLLELADVSNESYTCVPMQGSGTYTVEAVLSTTVPKKNGKVVILVNGAYGRRMAQICTALDIPAEVKNFSEESSISGTDVSEALAEVSHYTHVAVIHCETSTGVFNNIMQIGHAVKKANPDALYFVDAMSSFGAVPINMAECEIDFLVSSSNKCIEGSPGFAYALAKTDQLLASKGNARSLSLDLVAQYEGLENNGQFRFTPPTHSILAFRQALNELEQEGGVVGRADRYKGNNRHLRGGMRSLGFKELLEPQYAGYIVTTFLYPSDKAFCFTDFYNRLYAKGQVIYPGKLLEKNCFRLGNIGHLYLPDMEHLLKCIEAVCTDMGMKMNH